MFFQEIIDRSSQIIYWLVTLTVRSCESFRGISIDYGGCSTIFLDDGQARNVPQRSSSIILLITRFKKRGFYQFQNFLVQILMNIWCWLIVKEQFNCRLNFFLLLILILFLSYLGLKFFNPKPALIVEVSLLYLVKIVHVLKELTDRGLTFELQVRVLSIAETVDPWTYILPQVFVV